MGYDSNIRAHNEAQNGTCSYQGSKTLKTLIMCIQMHFSLFISFANTTCIIWFNWCFCLFSIQTTN